MTCLFFDATKQRIEFTSCATRTRVVLPIIRFARGMHARDITFLFSGVARNRPLNSPGVGTNDIQNDSISAFGFLLARRDAARPGASSRAPSILSSGRFRPFGPFCVPLPISPALTKSYLLLFE